MFYQNFDNIKSEFLLDDQVYDQSLELFKKLKPSDTLTTGVYSRRTRLPFELAEKVLIECVNKGILQIQILVTCKEYLKEHNVYTFNSLREFSEAYNNKNVLKCPYCSGSFDFENPLVIFRRPDKPYPIKVR